MCVSVWEGRERKYAGSADEDVCVDVCEGQGGVTPIDSIVTAATAVGQWSTVKVAQTGAVNGQSGSKVQSKTRAALFMATCRQVLQGQIAERSKVNGRKSAWSTVKTPKTVVKALTRGRSCDYSVYGSDPPLRVVGGEGEEVCGISG